MFLLFYEFFLYQPSTLVSPTTVLRSQKGNCFDFSVLLCSLLIGAGYDAYCVCGYATRETTLTDETREICPLLKKKDEVSCLRNNAYVAVNFLSQVIFVFLSFLGMVRNVCKWSWNKGKIEINWDKKKLTTTYTHIYVVYLYLSFWFEISWVIFHKLSLLTLLTKLCI